MSAADVLEAPATTSGRRSNGHHSYLEGWAARYWKSQEAIERSRLRKGKARHRAHRDPIPAERPTTGAQR